VQLSLEGAAKGSMQEVIASLGNPNAPFDITPATLDGLEARKGSCFLATSNKGPVHIESMCIKQGQAIWQVQTLYALDTAKDDAKRLLDSVHVKAAPAPASAPAK